jgi:hypothetical protein
VLIILNLVESGLRRSGGAVMASFLGEIKRRKVFQVAAVYAVVAWLTIQIVDIVNEPLNLPDWLDTVVIILLAVGFPIAVILAWAFDLTPEGIKSDADVRARDATVQLDGQRLNSVLQALAELKIRGLIRPKPNIKDVELFEEFVKLFAEGDKIRFFKEHDFLASFHAEDIQPLLRFVESWNNATHEFVDGKIERARKKLYRTGRVLGTSIARGTVHHGDNLISVKPRGLPMGPTPAWVIRDAESINALKLPFVKAHEKFIKIGKKRLYRN